MMDDPASRTPLGDARQTTGLLLMVRPYRFRHNPETAPTNPWQRGVGLDAPDVARRAQHEFDGVVGALLKNGVRPIVMPEPQSARTPDAVFPNNWFSSHGDGTVVLYPMHAPNRRLERRASVLRGLEREFGLRISRVLDLTALETGGCYLEGTGSLVLDRSRGRAFAALSPRTHRRGLAEFAGRTGYQVLCFQTDAGGGQPVYHTNMLLSLGTGVAVLCADVIRHPEERLAVREALAATGRVIVEISANQMAQFSANCLEVTGSTGPVTLISDVGLASLDPAQRRKLEAHSTLCPVDVGTIERVGGGSIRCMLAEIYLSAGLPEVPVPGPADGGVT
jgi:hypothetical protein